MQRLLNILKVLIVFFMLTLTLAKFSERKFPKEPNQDTKMFEKPLTPEQYLAIIDKK